MGELKELSGLEVKYAMLCTDLYNVPVKSKGAVGSRWFGLVVDGRICAVAWVHKPFIFEGLFRKFNLDQSNSYFLRRITTCCPGEYAVELLTKLCEKLREEGKELLVVLGMPGHSNVLYRRAGFVEVGRTPRTNHPVFVKKLK